ncbi:MAG: hypothetical protein Harvfovirus31_13 [Harvfovirus sp.]|uniref:Uncharacterized protein n=1 Tax=Harvfovirus sp. TaxID=2487768 RepID=A0A3G5A2D9_9VIRU|nr:MAG: hypothetical protein Harvfovirus31_13 [Harvfovirus sp.]
MIDCICGDKYEEGKILYCNACVRARGHKRNVKKIHAGCDKCELKEIYVDICCECELMPRLVANEVYVVTNLSAVLCQIVGNFMEARMIMLLYKCIESSCYVHSCLSHMVKCRLCKESICSTHQSTCYVCKDTFCVDCYRAHNIHPVCGFVGPLCVTKDIECAICGIDSNHHHIIYRKENDNICKTERTNVCCDHIRHFSRGIAQDEITHTKEHKDCHCQEAVCPDDLEKCDTCSTWIHSAHKKMNLPSLCGLCEGKSVETYVCCSCLKIPGIRNLNTKICSICNNHACADHFERGSGLCNKCNIEQNAESMR